MLQGRAPHGPFHKVYVNTPALKSKTPPVKYGSIEVKENYSPAKIEKIKKLKEEEYQDGFLRDLFVDVFGYTLKPDDNYNLVREFKNQGDGKKSDGAILKNEKAVAVIELKSTKTKDLKSITEQAFNYKNNPCKPFYPGSPTSNSNKSCAQIKTDSKQNQSSYDNAEVCHYISS